MITRLGIGVETDALFAGMAVPQLVLLILSGSLTHVLVPLLSGENDAELRESAWGFFLSVTALFGAIAVVLYSTAPLWVSWILPGFSAAARDLTVHLTRIQLVGMVFTASISVLWSVYYARHRFYTAEIAPIVGGVLSLVALVPALPRYGVAAAAWANVARAGLPVLFLLPGLGVWRRPRWTGAASKEAWRRLRPLLAGTAYYKTDPLVDRILSSLAPAGGLSVLYIGQQIWGAASQIVTKAVAAPMVPVLAVQAKSDDWAAFHATLRRRSLWMLCLTGGGFLLFLVVGRPALHLLIGHGGVTAENVDAVWRVMVALGGVLIAGSVGQVTAAAFYAYGDTRTPTRLGVVTYTIYIPIKIASFLAFGLIGLAASTSLFVTVNALLQMRLLGRRQVLTEARA